MMCVYSIAVRSKIMMFELKAMQFRDSNERNDAQHAVHTVVTQEHGCRDSRLVLSFDSALSRVRIGPILPCRLTKISRPCMTVESTEAPASLNQ